MFAEDQLERLRTFPDPGRDDLIRYVTLTPADVASLDPSRGRGRLTGSGLPLRWRRCRGWGSCPMRCGWHPGGGGPAGGAAEAGSGGAGRVWAARIHPVGSCAAGGRLPGVEDRPSAAMKNLEQFLPDRAMANGGNWAAFSPYRHWPFC
jgi:hypothetical protein